MCLAMCCSVLHIRSAIQMTRDLYTLRDTPSRRPIECLLMNTHRMPSLMHHLPQISHTTDVLTQTEIRKSPTADKFALQNDCRVHFREFLPAWAPHRCADSGQNPQKPAHYPVFYQMTKERTIENFYLSWHRADVPTQFEILKGALHSHF